MSLVFKNENATRTKKENGNRTKKENGTRKKNENFSETKNQGMVPEPGMVPARIVPEARNCHSA